MERWYFGEDKANGTSESMQQMQLTDPTGRKHIFRVLVNQPLEPNEVVAVTGECSSLGKWLPARVVQLQREFGEFEASPPFTTRKHPDLFHFVCKVKNCAKTCECSSMSD